MNWTQLLKNEIETTYATTAKLLDRVDSDSFDWKPKSGSNWMTVGQLVKHITEACGLGCRGFVTGDWGLPPGKTWGDLTPEEMLPPAEKLPSINSVEKAKDLLAKDRILALQMIDQAGENDLAWSPDGKTLYANRLEVSFTDADIHAIDVASGKTSNLTGARGPYDSGRIVGKPHLTGKV